MKRSYLIAFFMLISAFVSAQNYYIAHRGASYLAPENTVAAAKLAWELDADAVEIDIHQSVDKRVMVIHDVDTKRTSKNGEKLIVAETSSEELRRLDVGSFKGEQFAGEKIPFVEEVLATVPTGKTLVIEIKCGEEVLPSLEKAVRESGKADQVVFISFGWETILATRKSFPNNECYYLKMLPSGLSKKIRQSAVHGLNGVNLYHKIISKKVVKRAKALNLEVLAWTVDKPEDVARLNRLGVNKITTNRPAWLKKQMDEMDN